MKAPLILCSSSVPINVKKIFKLVLARALELKPSIPEIHQVGYPLVEYTSWRLHGEPETDKEKDKEKDGSSAK